MSGEPEDILEDIAMETELGEAEDFTLGEEEWESLGEEESLGEWEGSFEEELEGTEGEEFLGGLWKKVKALAPKVAPILKKLAPVAGTVIGGALGGPAGAALSGKLGGVVSQLEAEEEYFDGEGGDTEDEMEAQVVPGLTPSQDVMAEVLAGQAAEVESEEEAEALAGGTTIYIVGQAPLAVKRVSPALAKGTARLTRLLRKRPQTRPFIKAIPTITKKTVATLSRKAAKGKPVTPKTAIRTMAKQTMRLFGSPKKTAVALVRNQVKRKKLSQPAVARAEQFV